MLNYAQNAYIKLQLINIIQQSMSYNLKLLNISCNSSMIVQKMKDKMAV